MGSISTRTWILYCLFGLKYSSFFSWHHISRLLPEQHLVKLVWDTSIVVFVLPRAWIFVLGLEYRCSFDSLMQKVFFLFVWNPFHLSNWMWFSSVIVIEIWARANSVQIIFFKSTCFWIEKSFIVFIEVSFLSGISIVRSWAWNLDLFDTLSPPKSITSRSKARWNRFATSQLIIVVAWSRLPLILFSTNLICLFPGRNTFGIEARFRIICEICCLLLAWNHFFHLIFLILSKA